MRIRSILLKNISPPSFESHNVNIAGQGLDVETSKLFDGRQRQPRLQVGLGRQEEEEWRHVQLLRKAATPLGLWNGLHDLFVISLYLICTVEHFLTVILSLLPKTKYQMEQINNFSLNHLHWKSDKAK